MRLRFELPLVLTMAAAAVIASLARAAPRDRIGDWAAEIIHCPTGTAVNPDGILAPREWADAESASIVVRPGWIVETRLKHDASHLYLLFQNVKHGDERLFPEVFIDPTSARGTRWEPTEWWFHVSHNLCEAAGQPNVYQKDGVFLCSHEKDGWQANNPPGKDGQIVEIALSYRKLGLTAATTHIGLALAVTNATGDATQRWFYWPRNARIDRPDTWGDARLD